HFTWYNRYAKMGDGVPPNVEPAALHIPGNKKQTKTAQCQPMTSKELQEYMVEYLLLQDAFEEIFKWIDMEVQQILPDEYKILTQYADVLPAGGESATYPFTGFVINFNVTTNVHRDWNDLKFCVVLVLSEDCQGGDLCFMEPGIRLQLTSGNAVLFRSSELSHFNMHYDGMRASLVFHSDFAGEKWSKTRNGWE
ncbi:hypothetical protein BDN70DRAFT_764456, partial [Pholiota conissans]